MSILHAIVLGIVQGLTEFLPISSSGHLEIVPWLFNWTDFDTESTAKAFDTALHLGTLVAVLIYLRSDLRTYIGDGMRALIRRNQPATESGRRAWLLMLSAVPAGVVGAVLQDWITERLGKPAIIAVSLIVFGLVLVWADKRSGNRDVVSLSMRDALLIGSAQVLALNPGTSRAGITITASRMSGFSRDAAARLSFLMSVPIIAGAVVFQFAQLARDGVPDGLAVPMIAGIITAAVSGWFAMWGMIRLLRTRSFIPFVVYRCVIGVGILLALASSWR